MDSFLNKFDASNYLRRQTQVPMRLKEKPKDQITKIEFTKRKRHNLDNDYDEPLTNDRSTIFETRTQRESRKTMNYSGFKE